MGARYFSAKERILFRDGGKIEFRSGWWRRSADDMRPLKRIHGSERNERATHRSDWCSDSTHRILPGNTFSAKRNLAFVRLQLWPSTDSRASHTRQLLTLSLTLVLDKKKKKTGKTLEIDRFGRRREGNDRDDAQKQTPQTHRRHWQTWSLVGWRTGRGPSPPWFRGEERALRLAHNRELIPRVSDRVRTRRSIRSKVSLVFLISRTSSLCFFSLCFSLSRDNWEEGENIFINLHEIHEKFVLLLDNNNNNTF